MKNNLKKTIGAVAIASAVMITSCKNSPYPGYELGENGVYSKFYKHDEKGMKPKVDDVVQVMMSYRNSKDSVIFDSRKNHRSEKKFVEFSLAKPAFNGCFEDALMSMSVGDSASFMVNADSLYLSTFKMKELPKFITKGTMVTFEAKLLKVTTKEEADKELKRKEEERKAMMALRKDEEPKTLAKYIADNKITTKPTADGLYFIEVKKGNGSHPKTGDTVKVNYTGALIDGKIFDTNDKEAAQKANMFDPRRPYEPVEFPVGGLIKGFDEALLMMSPGSKAKLIIPSEIGYGEQGGGQVIQPYSTLVFDVELVSFKAAKKGAPAAPPMPKKK